MKLFSGLSAFPITPMTSAGEVFVPDLQGLVRRIEAGGADDGERPDGGRRPK